jgi:hypothetical protein
MKWYNIDNYKPPCDKELLIRIESDTGEYDRYIIGICEDLNTRHDASKWKTADQDDIDINNYNVTHFCIPDPVEVEFDE